MRGINGEIHRVKQTDVDLIHHQNHQLLLQHLGWVQLSQWVYLM